MLLNEHKSKQLFAKSNIPVPQGMEVHPGQEDAFNPDFPLPWYLKAQVLSGGRGKAGGILRVDNPNDFPSSARNLFSMQIKGQDVPFIRVEPAATIKTEFYLSLSVSRKDQCILLSVGQGGMDVEKLGADNLLIQQVRLPGGLTSNQIRAALFHLGLDKSYLNEFNELLSNLFQSMRTNGLLLAEINPLVITGEGQFLALDGKVEIDDNYAEINSAMEEYYQREHASSEENEARDAGLSYVTLPGWVGLIVNGAGLAMATMDLLNFSRLSASNFLDLGGAADQKRMRTALELLFGDPKAKAIFINMFGGILSCRNVALALRDALGGQTPAKPIVARMSGNDAEGGLAVLREIGADNIHIATDMQSAIDILETLKPKDAPVVPFAEPESISPAPRSLASTCNAPIPLGINSKTAILVQGITGREGQLHTKLMQEYGANIVAGVTPFKGGQEVFGIPVFNSIAEAKREYDIDASIIFVPPRMAADAVMEAAFNEIPWAVCITEGIPQHDMLAAFEQIKHSPTRVIGPNTPGIIIPGKTKIGIMPIVPFSPGPVAIISRSGTLTYEVAARLSANGIGQSICVGIGGDPFIGTDFVDMFEILRNHKETEVVVVLGEIGGTAEENLAEYVLETGFDKPIISFIAGRTAPPGKRLGHAGAILEKNSGIENKLRTMQKAGFAICPTLEAVAAMTANSLGTAIKTEPS